MQKILITLICFFLISSQVWAFSDPLVKVVGIRFKIGVVEKPSWQLIGDGMIGDNWWQVGSSTTTKQWSENYLTQTLENRPQLQTLSFEYMVETTEMAVEFDQPRLAVGVNDGWVWFAPQTTGDAWQRANIDLSSFFDETLVIKIYSGNHGDSQFPTWANLRNLKVQTSQFEDPEDIVSPQIINFLSSRDDLQSQIGYARFKLQDDLEIKRWWLIAATGATPDFSTMVSGLILPQPNSNPVVNPGEFWLKFELPASASASATESAIEPVTTLTVEDWAGNQTSQSWVW